MRLTAKGKTDPVPAFRLIEVTPGAAGFARHLDAPMVGRERELALLRSAFERTVSDQACQLFTVLGVGGVGKSRLMAAFVDELGDRATVLRGRCLPYGEGITFYPLAEALHRDRGSARGRHARGRAAKLAALAGSDEDAGRIAELVGQAIGIARRARAPEETFWAIRMLLEHLAADRPLVFAIDDLQWAEPKFLELVEHVADFARDASILLACMARPELLDDHPGWAGGKLNATSILIEPLGPEECGTLVANLLADDTVDEAVRTRIAEAAEGHPLYAEEMTGLLVDEGRLVLKEGRWIADDRPVRRAGPADDLGAAGRPAGQAADRRTAADRHRLGDGTGLLPERASVRWPTATPTAVGSGITRARPQAVRPAGTIRSVRRPRRWRSVTCSSATPPTTRVPKATRAELHERFADVVGRGRRIARGAGRDRRLPPRAGLPLPGRAGSRRRTRAAARRRGRSAPRGRGRAGVRPQRLLGIDQPPLSGVRVARSRRPDCGSASLPDLGSALDGPETWTAPRRPSTKRSSEPQRDR